MKKIVFVIGVLSNGGAERVISVLSKQLLALNYKVEIVTIYGDKNDYVKDSQITIKPIICKSSNKVFKAVETLFMLRKYLKRTSPDLVISFVAIVNIYTILSSAFLKNRLIVSERNDPYQNPERKYIRKIRNILYRYCDGFVFQTEDAQKYFPVKIQRKSIVIANPLLPKLPYWQKNDHSKTIITASRLVKQKNIPMLIDAFVMLKKDFPEYKLKIYGIGELRQNLLEYIDDLGMKNDIFLPGFSIDIHDEMAKSSIFVLSSNYEGISNSMLEALAIGVPVVSTDSPIGGARMFINNDRNGLLTKVGDTYQLYSAMKKVISNKEFAYSLSSESVKIRMELSAEFIANKWQEYIDEVCVVKDEN